MIITDDHIAGAQVLADAHDEIIVAAEMALMLRGVTDTAQVFEALIGAAWTSYKQTLGADRPEIFARVLRNTADAVERHARPN
jgi:hypothetical protein